MRQLPILSAILLTAPTALYAQVTVDLHALQALPDQPAAGHAVRVTPTPPATAVVANTPAAVRGRQALTTPTPAAVTATAPAATGTAQTTAAATAARPQQPAMPQSVPDTATIGPITLAEPTAAAKPPAPPPVSDKAATATEPTTSGLRVTFAPGAADLSPESVASIKQLTATAPSSDMTTFNVLAYAPGKADDPSTARRISLSRAMAVRSALVADGVPSARIFVRALGEQYGDGPADRVDLSVSGTNAPSSSAAVR